jgi:hypothetical protein
MFRDRYLVLAGLFLSVTPAFAQDPETSGGPATWLADQIAAVRRAESLERPGAGLRAGQVWARGIDARAARSSTGGEKAVGATFQPFESVSLRVGTEVVRAGADPVRANLNWEYGWQREALLRRWLTVGVSTRGSVGALDAQVSQSVGGHVAIRLLPKDARWTSQLRLTPSMTFDATSGLWSQSLTPEIVGRTVISKSASPIHSVVNLSVGAPLAPHAAPALTARIELRMTPKL